MSDLGQGPYSAPSMALLWAEYPRAAAGALSYPAIAKVVARAPKGDGHDVLVLPGLLADDCSTVALRHLLRASGYRPRRWRLGRNLGPTPMVTEGLLRSVDQLYEQSDGPISLIGWSLGGMYARELARRQPHKIRTVITLGSPFRLGVDDPPSATHAGHAFHALRPWHTDFLDGPGDERDRDQLQMPATSIYSRLDGVVPWQACCDIEGSLRENVEVDASHLGFGTDPAVLAIILDRLAQPIGDWHPFEAAA